MNHGNMPPDPFNVGTPDLTGWASTCRGMYTSLVAAGFTEPQALDITVKCVCALLVKAALRVGWNKDHKHAWELQLHVTWVVEGKIYYAACCACGKAGWKLSPVQGNVI